MCYSICEYYKGCWNKGLTGECCPDCKEFTYRKGKYRCAIDNNIVSDYGRLGVATGLPYLDKDMLFKIWKIMVKKGEIKL
jgi:hypothetical protein